MITINDIKFISKEADISSFYFIEAGSFIGSKKVVSYFCRYNFHEFMYKGIELK